MPRALPLTRVPALLGTFAALGALGTSGAAPAAAQAPATPPAADLFVGTWYGTLQAGPAGLRVSLAVRRDSAGGLAGVFTSLDQGNARIPATITARGDTLRAAVAAASIAYTGVLTAGRDSLRGEFRQGGGAFPLVLTTRGGVPAPAPAAARPQDPRPPFPYRTSEVTIPSAAGVRLAATVTLPAGAGPFPAVVFVTGSGPQDRDEALFGHRPFLVIADHLARRGIASVRYDDRGVAKSTGDFAAATSADFADDAEAAVRFARTVPGIAPARVGILGHSEGGLVGPMVAARSRDVAFVVMLAGPGVPGDSLLILQGAATARAVGAPAAAVEAQAAAQRRLFAAVRGARDSADAAARVEAAGREILPGLPEAARGAAAAQLAVGSRQVLSPWFRYLLSYDPRPALRRVRVPVLALNGALDTQVPAAENLAAVAAALRAGGNRDAETAVLPGLNHLFQTAKTGAPGEYAAIDETVAPAALERIAGWIGRRFAGPAR